MGAWRSRHGHVCNEEECGVDADRTLPSLSANEFLLWMLPSALRVIRKTYTHTLHVLSVLPPRQSIRLGEDNRLMSWFGGLGCSSDVLSHWSWWFCAWQLDLWGWTGSSCDLLEVMRSWGTAVWNFQGDTSEAGFYRIICEVFFSFSCSCCVLGSLVRGSHRDACWEERRNHRSLYINIVYLTIFSFFKHRQVVCHFFSFCASALPLFFLVFFFLRSV